MIGFIGFGQTVDTTRDPNVPAANRFRKTNRYIPPASVLKSNQRSWDSWADATDFQKIFDFTDPDPGRRVWRAQHNIFPRPEEFADLPLALWHAHNMLMQIPGAESAQNSIFIVTSGLTHCRRDNSNDKELPFGKGPVCGRGFDAHQASLKEVLDYRIAGSADWRLATDKIPLHTIFVGSKVAPHTIAVHKFGSNPPVCLTEKELRQRNLYTTLPATTSHEETSASYDSVGKGSVQQGDHSLNYYQSAHWLSAAARQVGGLWIPIRMDTVNCGWSVGCADNTLLPEINSACAMKPMPYGPNPATGKYPNPSYPADIFPGATVKFNVKGDSWLNSTTPPNSVPADSEGRIFCDVNCNETRGIDGVSNQIDSALGEMYRLPPISLVDEP
jgi:hypothetical protein